MTIMSDVTGNILSQSQPMSKLATASTTPIEREAHTKKGKDNNIERKEVEGHSAPHLGNNVDIRV